MSEACACPHCGKPISLTNAEAPEAITLAVARVAGIGLARTRHDPAIEIVQRTAEALDTTAALILSKTQHRSVTFARHLAMYVIRRDLDRSFPEIAEVFGCHHSSVMHGCRRIVDMHAQLETGESVATLVDVISTGRGLEAFDDNAPRAAAGG